MSIKTNYDLNGVEITDAVIRVDRLWGSSREGWTSLVGVYLEKEIPAVAEVTEEQTVLDENSEEVTETVIVTPAVEAHTILAKVTEFNHGTEYVQDERGYVSIYGSLMSEFGGIEV